MLCCAAPSGASVLLCWLIDLTKVQNYRRYLTDDWGGQILHVHTQWSIRRHGGGGHLSGVCINFHCDIIGAMLLILFADHPLAHSSSLPFINYSKSRKTEKLELYEPLTINNSQFPGLNWNWMKQIQTKTNGSSWNGINLSLKTIARCIITNFLLIDIIVEVRMWSVRAHQGVVLFHCHHVLTLVTLLWPGPSTTAVARS